MMPEIEKAAVQELQRRLAVRLELTDPGYTVVACDHGVLIERYGHAFGLVQFLGADYAFFLISNNDSPVFREQKIDALVERIAQFVQSAAEDRT